MTRSKKLIQTSKKRNNDELETNTNNFSSLPNDTNTFDNNNYLQDTKSSHDNFATTSNLLQSNTNAFSEIPSGVKQYINAAFEKQTLKIKALF
jgi:hypothetical protein